MLKRLTIYLAVLGLLASVASLAVGCGGKTTRPETTLEVPQLDSGPISGKLEDGVWTYLGIPYAAPPVGGLRWEEPQPVHPWDEVRPCTEFGPACPQPKSDWTGVMDVGEMSEDCLYLNVWTPAKSPAERLAVMVWIHGGAFQTGASSLEVYDGHNLAKEGVVVVSINYRLGPLGFMAHPLLSRESRHGVSGNYGLLDQIAALEWVQRNIAVFGGDPYNVTVFGQSAGGMSILDLMASPLAGGLFDRAIVESGPLLNLGFPLNRDASLNAAERMGEEISKKLGCDKEKDELAALRSRTPQELMEASSGNNLFLSPINLGINLGPNIDGYVLPEDPLKVFLQGRQSAVPLLVGINANEGTVFAPEINLAQYRLMLNFVYRDFADEVLALFPGSTPQEIKLALDKLITQMGFAASARFTAACMEKVGAPAYLYQFVRTTNDPRIRMLGSFHSLEIAYVFGNLDKIPLQGLEGADVELSRKMMAYWVNFAKTGDPNGKDLEKWPAYEGGTEQYQELGDTTSTRSNLFQAAYDLVMRINGW